MSEPERAAIRYWMEKARQYKSKLVWMTGAWVVMFIAFSILLSVVW